MRKYKLKLALLLLLIAFGLFETVVAIHHIFGGKPAGYSTSSSSAAKKSLPPTEVSFNKNLYSTDEAGSLWVVVNKGRVLPSMYLPANLVVPNVPLRLSSSSSEMHLRTEAASELAVMVADGKKAGVNLMLASGYRSYANQVATYNGFVTQNGQTAADTFSARPGHSEHQTGLAADLEPTSRKCELEVCFADTPEGKWLAANCYKYGFIIRYQKDTQGLTGYQYEPWHIRYVGKDLAEEIYKINQTLEQFFGLPSYTSYPAQVFKLTE